MQQLGKYITMAEKISEGGTSVIYAGVDLRNGSAIAIKKLKPEYFQSSLVRNKFKEEANRYLYLDHPNIVRLHDFMEFGDSHYLIMELVEGINLFEYQNKVTGPMPVSMAALLVSESLKALEYAHNNGVVHLDVKPANIMLTDSDEIKVLDFGISKNAAEKSPKELMGTPSYMSPEQLNSKNIDHLTDIYSAGITLYELIAGETPFPNCTSREELFKCIRSTPVPKLKKGNGINEIIQKATSKDKRKRYQSCGDFYSDLIELAS